MKFSGKPQSPFDQAKSIGSVYCSSMFKPSYMHTFSITPNYFVIIEQPLCVNVRKLMDVFLHNHALIEALDWNDDEVSLESIPTNKIKVNHCFNKIYR